ncbi:MAG: ArsR family transcriptional regulator [Frankiales bacterium]|nr:ArsR family transcriptional regulator [Frankiales bacterium]
MTDKPSFVYVTYIQASPATVWQALTSADLTAQYWGHANISDWQAGSHWEHRRVDGSEIADVIGTVLESDPPRRLVLTFDAPPVDPGTVAAEDPSTVTFAIEPYGDIVKVTVTHEKLVDQGALDAVSLGWPAVMANLKSLLETGKVLSEPPWQMPSGVTAG